MQRQVVGGLFVLGLGVAGSAVAMPSSSSAADADQVAVAVEQPVGLAGGFSDEAAMVLLGTALIGLAGAVKRAA